MNLLPPSTVKLIASSQVITSVSSVAKELIENSLDAGASSIEVKLDGWGLERIEVRDNGCGIKLEDAPFIAQPHYTSKISSDTDLKVLHTYGFRGEALGSLSSLSNLCVLTKTESEQVGMLYTIGHHGHLEASQPKPATTGTTVIATNLFKNLPVRKQFSSNNKKCKDELKKVEDLVMAYSLIHPALRISLRHNKVVVWQKNKVSNHRTALLSVFGTALLAQMGAIESRDEDNSGIDVVGYLPRPGSDFEITGRAVNDRCFVFVNRRPVDLKFIYQLIRQYYTLYSSRTPGGSNRYPIAFLSIVLPPDSLDVNVEPNKTSVMLTNKDELFTLLTKLLDAFYSDERNRISENKTTSPCNFTVNGTETSGSHLHLTREAFDGGIAKCQSSKNGRFSDKKDTFHSSNDDPTFIPSNCSKTKDKGQEKSHFMDQNRSFDQAHKEKQFQLTQSDAQCCLNDNLLNFSNCNGDDLLREGTSHQKQSKGGQVENSSSCDCSPCSDAVISITSVNRHKERDFPLSSLHHDEISVLPKAVSIDCAAEETVTSVNKNIGGASSSSSAQQEGTNTSGKVDMPLVPSFSNPTEVCEMLCDKTVCEGNDAVVSNKASSNCVRGNKHVLDERSNVLPFKNGGEETNGNVHVSECSAKGSCRPIIIQTSESQSLKTLFSLDLDDLFDDSDCEISFPSKPDGGHSKSMNDTKYSAPNGSSVTEEKSVASVPPNADEKECSDKDWSMGHGIVDKQGNEVEPVTLLVPVPSCNKTPVTPFQRKRKHSSDQQSRLSLSSKKVKKIPEITNQPLITKIMSPNPLQRKLLYKKTEIPFCLNSLKDLAKKRRIEKRSVEQNSGSLDCLIGRLDPWGVWLLLRKGSDIVCVNQYRIQEQLLFHRLMECHSLPKERTARPITLNERIVGGPGCWQILCSMSSKCEAPDPTRFIDDERLTSNGFDVCLKTDSESGETKYEVFEMSTCIPFYGVPDLAELLELIHEKRNTECNVLSSYRPFKVVHYLQGEAVRMARSMSSRMNRSEVNDLIFRMDKQLDHVTRACVHGQPFFQTIAKISSK